MDNRTKEINEAIYAGQEVLRLADKVLHYLDKASTWGLIDMFSKGSLLSGLIKHSNMNSAEDSINELRYAINNFNCQLDDVKVYGFIDNIDFDGFMKFIDIFCDNFFIDILAVSKISDSKAQIKNLVREVNNIVERLKNY